MAHVSHKYLRVFREVLFANQTASPVVGVAGAAAAAAAGEVVAVVVLQTTSGLDC